MYLAVLFLQGIVLFNMPSFLFRWLFPPVSEDVIDSADQAELIERVRGFRELVGVLSNLRRSVFVRCDVFTISGISSLIFGLLLILRSFALCHVLHSFICVSMALMIWVVNSMYPKNAERSTHEE
jgi:hypothetical protein